MDSLKKLSPVSYILALLCFLLPFVQVSCGGQKLVSLTGVQLMTGTEIKPPAELFGMKAELGDTAKMTATSSQKTEPNWFATIAFIAGVAGLVFSVLKVNRAAVLAGIAGTAGAVCLLLIRVNISGEMSKNPMGAAFSIDYQAGYYVSLLLFIFGAVTLLMGEFRPAAMEAAAAGGQSMSSPPTAGDSTPSGMCSKCGAALRAGSRFCGACGTWSRGAAAN